MQGNSEQFNTFWSKTKLSSFKCKQKLCGFPEDKNSNRSFDLQIFFRTTPPPILPTPPFLWKNSEASLFQKTLKAQTSMGSD